MSEERLTYGDIFRPECEPAEEMLELRMTMRQAAAISFVFGRYVATGLFDKVYAELVAEDAVAAKGWLIAFGEMNACLGRMLSKSEGTNLDFSLHLAYLDQSKAEWRDEV